MTCNWWVNCSKTVNLFLERKIPILSHYIPLRSLMFSFWAQNYNASLKLSTHTTLVEHSKTCLKRPLKRRPKLVLKTDICLMLVKSIAECSTGSILQCFWHALSCHLSLRPFLSIFEWQLKTGFTVFIFYDTKNNISNFLKLKLLYVLCRSQWHFSPYRLHWAWWFIKHLKYVETSILN